MSTDKPKARYHRKEELLNAAVDLFRANGFHAASIDDIGAAVGMTGPAIYRHYPNKHSLLTASFDKVADELDQGVERIFGQSPAEREALRAFVELHVDFALRNRSLITVWYREEQNLPPQDRKRIRQRQRRYLSHWTDLLTHVYPDMEHAGALTLVHAAVGVIASTTQYKSRLARDSLRSLLIERAQLVLFGCDQP